VVALASFIVAIFVSSWLSEDEKIITITVGALAALAILVSSRKRMRVEAVEVPAMEIGPLSLLYVSLASAGLVTALNVGITPSTITGTIPLGSAVERLLLLVAFVATAIPFYHGALTYLHRTSINANRSTMVDFLVLMLEAFVILLLSTSSSSPILFVTWFASLSAIDVLWLVFALKGKRSDPPPAIWLYLNVVMFFFLLAALYLQVVSDSVTFLFALALTSVSRSVVDYTVAWRHYFPPIGARQR